MCHVHKRWSMKGFLALSFTLMATLLSGEDHIRVQGVNPTPESVTVAVVLSFPKMNQIVKNPVYLQARIDGFALGADSVSDRKDEIVGSDMGQTLHVVIDDMPYFAVNGPAIDPFREEGYFYDTSYKFKIPKNLSTGQHVIRAFACRSYGESLKGERSFYVLTINVNNADHQMNVDLTKPYLTYNEPSNNLYLVDTKPVLLDFYISNCELTQDGYKVRLTVDGKMVRKLTSWQPYYIYGLRKGGHTVRLELIDRNDKLVPGPFNDVTQQITIH